MRLFAITVVLATTACFSPRYQNGEIQCKLVGNTCPDGYHCAVNHTCWRNGLEPPPQHSGHVVFGAGGGIGMSSGNLHGATTSFGQMAGTAKGDGVHSAQFGVLAGTVTQ